MNDLIIKSPGKPDTNLGLIMKSRVVGPWLVRLTYDEPDEVWWIAATRDGSDVQLWGFIAKVYKNRREDAWQAFMDVTERELENNFDKGSDA